MDDRPVGREPKARLVWGLFILLGGYLTFAGYRSFEGDQAYRLPLLLHQTEPSLFANDPFVSSFDQFNPHRGYLSLLERGARRIGLPATLFVGFVLTFSLTAWAIGRLAHALWPAEGPTVGAVAVGLLLIAQAGNIGTNHLFEPMLLDRLVAHALGWAALVSLVRPTSLSALSVAGCVLAANTIHPSLGLQWGLFLSSGWLAYGLLPGWCRVPRTHAIAGLVALGLVLAPAVLALPGTSRILFSGMDPAQFHLVAAYVQSPQHMVPHLWRFPQWLAWFSYLAAAGLGIAAFRNPSDPPAETDATAPRRRLLLVLSLLLTGLLVAALAIEAGQIRVTLFQPFRMATVVRGLCLVLMAGPVQRHWRTGTFAGRLRAGLLAASLTSDWPLVWVVGLESLFTLAHWNGRRIGVLPILGSGAAIGWWLWQHDPERGYLALGLAVGLVGLVQLNARRFFGWTWTPARSARLAGLAWSVPVLAFAAQVPGLPPLPRPLRGLTTHLRYFETPIDDLERLAVWCRDHTPADARFVGPPGPKGFRLWSRRAVAFNRAGSPYHAAGLADWAARFQAHVGHTGDLSDFAKRYLANRQALEQQFDRWDAEQLARLAADQKADYVFVARPLDVPKEGGPLGLIHAEGRYAVYRVVPMPRSERPARVATSTLPARAR
jgi:hypothetical protein